MNRLLMLAAASLVVTTTAHADEPKIDYQKFTLPNGLDVFVIEDAKAPTVYEVLWVKTGSKDEVANRTGFAHLFEHLMFKGSKHVPDGKLDRLLEGAGGYSNAFTSSDMTVYHNVAGSNFLEQVLWLEADRLAGLLDTFDKAKLDNQRDVVLNERRQSYENQPYGLAYLLLSEALWPKDHGYHWSTIGYVADLEAANVTDVSNFFRTYYVPNNMTMVVAGNVKFAEVKPLVEKYFAWMPRGKDPARPKYKTPAPITKEIVIDSTDDVQVPRVYFSWRAPAQFTPEDPALKALAGVLGEGKSSRLYERLVYKEKIAQSVQAGYDGQDIGGDFSIIVTAKPGVTPEQLTKAVNEEVARIAATPPTAVEVERAVNSAEASFLGQLEDTKERAILLAQYNVQAKDPDFFAKDLARRRAVTPAQIKDAAAKYLKTNQRVRLTIRPGKKPVEKK